MSRLRQLAMQWRAQANADIEAAPRIEPPIGRDFAVIARTRRNCAWELMRVLNEMEKENPLDGGYPSPHTADRESA